MKKVFLLIPFLLIALALGIYMLYLVVINYQNKEEFEQESKAFRVCAILENKHIIQGNPNRGRTRTSLSIAVFRYNDLKCSAYPSSTSWAKLKVDQKYFIMGRATKTRCQLKKIEGRC